MKLREEEVREIYRRGEDAMVGLFMELQEQVGQLRRRMTELEGRLKKDSHNSNKPPSSDGYGRPSPKSQRKKSGRQSGGQPGHEGRTLEMVAKADRIEEHWPSQCESCGGGLKCKEAQGYDARQVHDIPPIQVEVTEHRAMQVCCGQCGATTQGKYPDNVKSKVQYGSGITALGVYIQAYQLLPLERGTEFLRDVAGREVSDGTLVNMLANCAQRLTPIEAQIKAALLRAVTVNVDETGLRVKTKLHWLHVVSNDVLTYYAVDTQRGKSAQERIGILPTFEGIAIHDALPSYLKWSCKHSLCNAHLLRELTALEETTDQRWPTRLKSLLVDMKTAVDQAVERKRFALSPAIIAKFQADYDQLVRTALRANPRPKYQLGQRGRPRASPARNLAERLRDHKQAVLLFIHDFRASFDNNQAERDLRMMKVKQKISGCFRSLHGARIFATVRGYISTVRKQGFSALNALRHLFDDLPVALNLG